MLSFRRATQSHEPAAIESFLLLDTDRILRRLHAGTERAACGSRQLCGASDENIWRARAVRGDREGRGSRGRERLRRAADGSSGGRLCKHTFPDLLAPPTT